MDPLRTVKHDLRTVKQDGPRRKPVEMQIWDAAEPVGVAAGGGCKQSAESLTLRKRGLFAS